MQRPCAYCKLDGHHIRDCEERKTTEERKRNCAPYRTQPQPQVQSWQTVRSSCPLRKVETVEKVERVENAKNLYANLYSSSDDEVEEGEIVEEDRHPRTQYQEPEPIYVGFTKFGESDPNWSRSGIKGVVISTSSISISSDDDEGPECDYDALEKGMLILSAYTDRFKGLSWADIECDSDFE